MNIQRLIFITKRGKKGKKTDDSSIIRVGDGNGKIFDQAIKWSRSCAIDLLVFGQLQKKSNNKIFRGLISLFSFLLDILFPISFFRLLQDPESYFTARNSPPQKEDIHHFL